MDVMVDDYPAITLNFIINMPPVFTMSQYNFSIYENAVNESTVGSVTILNPSAGN